MDYRYADSAIVRPTSDGTRFDLVLFEGGHVLHIWGLTDGFTAPDAPIRDNWFGIEDINFRLADAKIAPSGSNAWTVIGENAWRREIFPQRERNANDH
jgi:hypothetical protein